MGFSQGNSQPPSSICLPCAAGDLHQTKGGVREFSGGTWRNSPCGPCLLDAQNHTLTIDVADLEHPPPLAMEGRCHEASDNAISMWQVAAGGSQQPTSRGLRDDGQLVRHPHGLHLGHQLATVEVMSKKTCGAADRGIQRRRGARIDEVQLVVLFQILDGRRIRRTAGCFAKCARRRGC